MKKVLKIGLGLLILAIGVLLFNTIQFESKQLDIVAQPAPDLEELSLQRFTEAIQIKTISYGDSIPLDTAAFNAFHRFLLASYPLTHQKLEFEKIEDYCLLYKWKGREEDAKPIVLMAHMDVVPIEPGTETMWTVDPFMGIIKKRYDLGQRDYR